MISEHGDPLAPLGGQQAGGQNVYVYELASILSRLGIKVDVFTRWENESDSAEEQIAPNAKVVRIEAGPKKFISKDKFGPLMPDFVKGIYSYSQKKQINYDLIHSHYYYSGWAGVKLKKIFKIPLIITFHSLGLVKRQALGQKDSSPSNRIAIEKQVMTMAENIIAVSPDEKKHMLRLYKAEEKKILTIPPGVNLKQFKPFNKVLAKKKLSLPLDKKIIVFAGKMEKRKGGVTLIKAIDYIRINWPETFAGIQVYMISGDPREVFSKELSEKVTSNYLKSISHIMGFQDTIIFLPGMRQDFLRLFFAAADIVVVPSYYEPFGMVATEAMATGTPVVASFVGGLKCSVLHGKTGLHAKPHSAKGFAKNIVKILEDEDLKQSIQKNAYLRVRNNFNWFWNAREILFHYEKLIRLNRLKKVIYENSPNRSR